MCVFECADHQYQQAHARIGFERMLRAILVDAGAVNEFQREPWPAVVFNAGIVNCCDVGMLQPRENVTLAGYALMPAACAANEIRQLQRDVALHYAIDAMRAPDARASALTNHGGKAVGADDLIRAKFTLILR